ncbi:MAG: hypothetical protein JWO80_6032 [Bryobacterales bacterium]|nr:hypothetical protein [Bryobacterales bacterium]
MLPQKIKADTEKEHVVEDMHYDGVEYGARSGANPAGKDTEQECVRHDDRITMHRSKKRRRDANGAARRQALLKPPEEQAAKKYFLKQRNNQATPDDGDDPG